ncbi:hypothetical protein FRC17_008030 [Serendipita sp. 399]|nr:hypothetical protein FRC17_008030 [Serendipita sp. 399]
MSVVIKSTLDASRFEIFASMKHSLSSLFVRLQTIESLEAVQYTSSISDPAVSLSDCEQKIADLSRQLCSKIDDYLGIRESLPGSSTAPVASPVSFSPISLCPDEVLGHIFEALIKGGSHNLRPLLTVNRRFHRLIMSAPRLWRKIFIYIDLCLEDVNSLSTSWVTACLERSGEVLLDIVMNCDGIRHISEFLEHYAFETLETIDLEEKDKKDVIRHMSHACSVLEDNGIPEYECQFYDRKMDMVVDIVHALMSQAHRWASAIISPPDLSYTEKGAREMFTCRMPNLQSLQIDYYDFARLSELIPDSPWPKLTKFAFTSYIIDLSNAYLNLAQLRSLTFMHSTERFDFSNMSILSGCASLQELDIRCETMNKKESHPPIDVHISSLKSLSLSGEVDSISYVHFILPVLEQWDLRCDLHRYIPDIDARHVSWKNVRCREEITIEGELNGITRLFSRLRKAVSVTLKGLKHPKSCIMRFGGMKAAGTFSENLRRIEVVGVATIDLDSVELVNQSGWRGGCSSSDPDGSDGTEDEEATDEDTENEDGTEDEDTDDEDVR